MDGRPFRIAISGLGIALTAVTVAGISHLRNEDRLLAARERPRPLSPRTSLASRPVPLTDRPPLPPTVSEDYPFPQALVQQPRPSRTDSEAPGFQSEPAPLPPDEIPQEPAIANSDSESRMLSELSSLRHDLERALELHRLERNSDRERYERQLSELKTEQKLAELRSSVTELQARQRDQRIALKDDGVIVNPPLERPTRSVPAPFPVDPEPGQLDASPGRLPRPVSTALLPESTAAQTGIEITPAGSPFRYDFHFDKAPLPQALARIGREAGRNLVCAGDLEGTLTADWKNLTIDEALQATAIAHGLTLEPHASFTLASRKPADPPALSGTPQPAPLPVLVQAQPGKPAPFPAEFPAVIPAETPAAPPTAPDLAPEPALQPEPEAQAPPANPEPQPKEVLNTEPSVPEGTALELPARDVTAPAAPVQEAPAQPVDTESALAESITDPKSKSELKVKLYRPVYVTAADLVPLIRPLLTPGSGRIGLTRPDSQQPIPGQSGTTRTVPDALMIADSAEVQSVVERLIQDVDQASPHVELEATILDVQRSGRVINGVGVLLSDGAFETGPGLATLESQLAEPCESSCQTSCVPATEIVRQLKLMTEVRQVSTARLLVLNRQSAELDIGTETVSWEASGFRKTSATIDQGARLYVRPIVTGQDQVRLDVSPEAWSSRSPNGHVRHEASAAVGTTVVVTNGGSLVIAGLTSEATVPDRPRKSSLNKLKKLFHKEPAETVQRELVMIITPRIIPPESPVPLPTGSFPTEQMPSPALFPGESFAP